MQLRTGSLDWVAVGNGTEPIRRIGQRRRGKKHHSGQSSWLKDVCIGLFTKSRRLHSGSRCGGAKA